MIHPPSLQNRKLPKITHDKMGKMLEGKSCFLTSESSGLCGEETPGGESVPVNVAVQSSSLSLPSLVALEGQLETDSNQQLMIDPLGQLNGLSVTTGPYSWVVLQEQG